MRAAPCFFISMNFYREPQNELPIKPIQKEPAAYRQSFCDELPLDLINALNAVLNNECRVFTHQQRSMKRSFLSFVPFGYLPELRQSLKRTYKNFVNRFAGKDNTTIKVEFFKY